VIAGFRHKGLKRFHADDDPWRLPPDMVARIRAILSALDVADGPSDLDLPSFRLHPLKGDLRGFWAVTVRAN
jgi:proteic killer suppression protein